MIKKMFCVSIFSLAISTSAMDMRTIENAAYVGLVTSAVLLGYEIVNGNRSDDCPARCEAMMVSTNGGTMSCLDPVQQEEVLSLGKALGKAFCPIL